MISQDVISYDVISYDISPMTSQQCVKYGIWNMPKTHLYYNTKLVKFYFELQIKPQSSSHLKFKNAGKTVNELRETDQQHMFTLNHLFMISSMTNWLGEWI